MNAPVQPGAAEYNSLHDTTLQHTAAIGFVEKAHNSLNLTLLGFVAFGAWSKHQPQVAGEARATRQGVYGGTGRAVRPAASPAALVDAQRLVGEERHDLMPRRSGFVGQSAQRCHSSEHVFQSSTVFSRGFEVRDTIAQDFCHLGPSDDSLRAQVRFVPARHDWQSGGIF